MSIASLKEELLRELAVAALGDVTNHRSSMGAGTDLIDWVSGPANVLRSTWVFSDKGPGLIVVHVPGGSRIWLAPGTFTRTGNVEIVRTDVVYWADDLVGVSTRCVLRNSGNRDPRRALPTRFDEPEHIPLFPDRHAVPSFLNNVLNGHVQDP